MSDRIERNCRDIAAAMDWPVARASKCLHNMHAAGELYSRPSKEMARNHESLRRYVWAGIQPRKPYVRTKPFTPKLTAGAIIQCAMNAMSPLQRAFA